MPLVESSLSVVIQCFSVFCNVLRKGKSLNDIRNIEIPHLQCKNKITKEKLKNLEDMLDYRKREPRIAEIEFAHGPFFTETTLWHRPFFAVRDTGLNCSLRIFGFDFICFCYFAYFLVIFFKVNIVLLLARNYYKKMGKINNLFYKISSFSQLSLNSFFGT